jgi:hypothetical protein
MSTAVSPPEVQRRSRGRGLFWLGIAVCLLGIGLAALLFSMKILREPWYAPILATAGAVLLLASVFKRFKVVRLLVFLLVTAVAGFEWYSIGSLARLPQYTGPAVEGQPAPAFATVRADGRSFTDTDLRQGKRTVLVFFRGRW